jgi:hypothetical protein
MFVDPILELELARQRRGDFEQAAAIERLLVAVKRDRPKRAQLLLAVLGDLLISFGSWLRDRAANETDRRIIV